MKKHCYVSLKSAVGRKLGCVDFGAPAMLQRSKITAFYY